MRLPLLLLTVLLASVLSLGPPAALAEPSSAPMTGERLHELIKRIDEDARLDGTVVEFEVEGMPLVLVFDETADRMRLMSPVRKLDELEEGQLLRVMQANFDSALDARYAVANDVLWSIFVHPLASLSEEQFVVAIGQTINVVLTYGSSYSSGVFIFNGGDSGEIERRKLIDRLRDLLST